MTPIARRRRQRMTAAKVAQSFDHWDAMHGVDTTRQRAPAFGAGAQQPHAMEDQSMATDTAPATAKAGEVITSRSDIVAQFTPMLAAIPEAGEDEAGGMEAILAQLASATAIDQLDSPWSAQGLGKWVGEVITVERVTRRPSDFRDGFGWYLVVHARHNLSGERIVALTGATSVMAQLIKAHQLGAFPLQVVPRVADKPSANGYYPQHLEIVK